jgi:hypothetical protein
MANFDLNSYETVEQRHARALLLHPDLRCVTINHTTPTDRAAKTWVVEARVYLNGEDQAADLPKATEWAFEIDGVGMANKTSALENASTSALGRALRWAFGGRGASREEMEKVERAVLPIGRDWLAEASLANTKDTLRALWAEARANKAPDLVLKQIKAIADGLEGEDSVGGSNGS